MARGIEQLQRIVEEHNIIVPTKDIEIGNFDKITCRIIKFGKISEKHWPERTVNGVVQPANTGTHLRVYIHCYEWFSAQAGKNLVDLHDTVITINPKIQWLGELVALQTELEEKTKDQSEVFKHRLVLNRKDRKNKYGGPLGYIEVGDIGNDPNYVEGDENSVEDIDDEPAQTDQVPQTSNNSGPVTTVKTESNTAAPRHEKVKALMDACSTVEDAFKAMKPTYDASTDGEKKEILELYKVVKTKICMKTVSDAEPEKMVETAEFLNKKYFAKDPKTAAEFIEWATSLSGDIPF